MRGLFGDEYCSIHGWGAHAFIHEAAHAVAALDRGIPFEGVFIQSPAGWVQRNAFDTMLGGVELDPDPLVWLLPDPVAALEVVLAGSLAERMSLEHTLEGSYTADVEVWRRGLGRTAELTSEELDELSGGSFAAVYARTRTWIGDSWQRIRSVSVALVGATTSTADVVLAGTGPWRLTPEQVRAAAR